MMRITNSMMTSNTKNNINLNKLNEDNLNTQMATGQKIARPSDDPVIAIRALRLNTSLSQLNQYYDKNIPDAQAWLKVTETALSQTNAIFDRIKENLTTGASDTNTPTDRQKLLANMKGLRNEIYSQGNADYAGRTVFTGYRTGQSLTYLATDTDLDRNVKITQTYDSEEIQKAVGKMTYVTTGDAELDIDSKEIFKLRLPYDKVRDEDFEITADGGNVSVTSKSIAGLSQADIDDIYTNVPDGEAYLIPETGEIILGKTAADNLKASAEVSFDYNKESWESGDLRPEHYFASVRVEPDPKTGVDRPVYYNYRQDPATGEPITTEPDFQDQEMQVEVSFNQKITINTNANKVFTHDIARDIDDLLAATQDVVDMDTKIDDLKKELAAAKTDADKEAVQLKLDAANKEHALKKDKMQKMFSNALNIFEGYADRNNKAIADMGNLASRLEITKDRVADQIQSFKELADDNINITLTDTAIDLKNAQLALEAAQMAAGKIAQQSLLNYL